MISFNFVTAKHFGKYFISPPSYHYLQTSLQSLLEIPLKLIATALQLLTTDIRRNLELLHSRRTDAHRRAKELRL